MGRSTDSCSEHAPDGGQPPGPQHGRQLCPCSPRPGPAVRPRQRHTQAGSHANPGARSAGDRTGPWRRAKPSSCSWGPELGLCLPPCLCVHFEGQEALENFLISSPHQVPLTHSAPRSWCPCHVILSFLKQPPGDREMGGPAQKPRLYWGGGQPRAPLGQPIWRCHGHLSRGKGGPEWGRGQYQCIRGLH